MNDRAKLAVVATNEKVSTPNHDYNLCHHHDLPRFMCGCVVVAPQPKRQQSVDAHLGAVRE